jgi:hypothetical protein
MFTTSSIKAELVLFIYAEENRRSQSTTNTKISHELYIQAHEQFLKANASTHVNLSYTIQPLGTRAVREGRAKGGNILGLDPVPQTCKSIVDGSNAFAWSIILTNHIPGWVPAADWSGADVDETVISTLDGLRRRIENIPKSRDELLNFVFMNDDSPTQTVLDSYGTANLAKLKAVSAKYDPDGIFQKLQNDGVLLRKI